MGDKFLKKYAELFKDAVQINSIEDWEKYKDQSVMKLVCWCTWNKIKQNEIENANKLIEEACLQPQSLLLYTMEETAKRNISATSLQSSICYQKEENAYLLSFSDFDYHCYPAPLNSSQAETYKLFNQQFKMPIHKIIEFKPMPTLTQDLGNKKQRHAQSLPMALRLVTNNIKTILESTEISDDHKKLFMENITSLFASAEHECNVKHQRRKNNLTLFFAPPPPASINPLAKQLVTEEDNLYPSHNNNLSSKSLLNYE